ncbi:MAG: YetF domain-containing protein, partial [Cyclobacteriaceae bacterium]
VVFILQMTLAHLRKKKTVQNLIDNKPLLLMEGAQLLEENMKKAQVTESDIRGKLREANVLRLDQVKAVIFESTGDISVLHTDKDIEIEEFIITDVQK